MIDPITQYILEQENYLEERLPLGVTLAGLIGTKYAIRALAKSGVDPNITLAVSVGAVVTIVTWGAYSIYKDYFSKAAKICKRITKGISTKETCIDKYRAASRKQQINILKKGISLCPRTINPSECKKKLSDEIKNVEARIKGK